MNTLNLQNLLSLLSLFLISNLYLTAQNDTTNDDWQNNGQYTYCNDATNTKKVSINATGGAASLYVNSEDSISGGIAVKTDLKIGFTGNGINYTNYITSGLRFQPDNNFALSHAMLFKTGINPWNDDVKTRMIIGGTYPSGAVIMGDDVTEADSFNGARLSVHGKINTQLPSGYSPGVVSLGGFGMTTFSDSDNGYNIGCFIDTYNDADHNGTLNDAADRALLINSNNLAFYVNNPSGGGPRNGKPSLMINGTNAYHGYIGINTTQPQYRLDVCGTIRATEVLVESACIPDYVFCEDYDMPTLEEERAHIKKNGHLTGYDSAFDMNGRIYMSDYTTRNHRKIEELTLHLLDMDERMKAIEAENKALKAELNKQGSVITWLKTQVEKLLKLFK